METWTLSGRRFLFYHTDCVIRISPDVPLAVGARLGPYEVLSPLGSGGMGEVYRARDTKLGRDVALKVLPEAFVADPERVGRFQREAKTLASLSHPNIATIHGLEEARGVAALVLELVEGPTLADRIAQGALPLDEALPVARQIAEALEAAHEQGIIHRDLKPANIKITSDGRVKVLDFGLAKALDPASAINASATVSPTISMQATQAGVILGTAAYMSPEQARGRPVDRRADIWAFGVVLYEMVTGRKPFGGDDVGDVLASVIKEQPSLEAVPAPLRRLLQRCLEKDPKKRLRDISGVALLLEEPLATPVRTRTSWVPWLVAGTLAVTSAIALWAPWRATRSEPRPLVRLDVDLGPDAVLGSRRGTDVVIAPDGSRLVWVSRDRLFTRRLDQPKASEIAGTQGALEPFFSPDGQWVAFVAAGKLKKVSVEGGTPISLCDVAVGSGGTWSTDGRIIMSIDGGLFAIPEAGGPPTPLLPASAAGQSISWPQILPGNRAVVFADRLIGSTFDDANIDILTMPDGRRRTV